MPILEFRVGADYDKVIKLREEINKLEAELKNLDFNAPATQVKELEQRLASARAEFTQITTEAAKAGAEMDLFVKSMASTGAKILSTVGIGIGAKEFLGQMTKVRGEFQQIETSLEVLLGNKEKAAALMNEVKDFAKVSPLDLKSTAAAAQMMLGFNIEAEKVPRYLKAIGDISMGDSQRFNSLTLAFSQMSATGKLMGQDLNQMINAGFNPLQAIADKTGKSISSLKEEMSKGAISAQMVQEAFISATEAGGKFYQMSQKASETINGQISMLQDAIDAMFNDLGEANEGIILKSIQGATSLIENYEIVGKILLGLIATYGTYRVAVFTEIALTKSLAAATKGDAVAKGLQTVATKAATMAQAAFNKVANANPYVLLATAVVAVGSALWAFSGNAKKAAASQEALNKAAADASAAFDSEKNNIDLLFDRLRKAKEGTEEYASTQKMIIDQYGEYLAGLVDERNHLLDVEAAYNRVTVAARESANARAKEAFQKKADSDYEEVNAKSTQDIMGIIKRNVKGEKLQQHLMSLVNSDITNGGLSEETKSVLSKAMGLDKDGLVNKAPLINIERAIDENVKAAKARNAAYASANVAFGKRDNDFSKYGKEDLSNIKTRLSSRLKGTDIEEPFSLKLSDGSNYIFKEAFEVELALKDIDEALATIKTKEVEAEKNNLATRREKAKETWDKAKAELEKIEKNEANYTVQQYEQAKKEEQEAANAYKSLTKDNKPKSPQAKSPLDTDKLNRQLQDLEAKNQQEQTSLLEDGREKRLEIIAQEYEERIRAAERQKEDWIKANKDAKMPGLNAEGLNQEQVEALQKSNELAQKQREKATSELYKEEASAMRDYLKEYGTFQQRKLAIAEEYAEKIEKATTEGEKLSLTKEREAATRQVDMDAIKSEIDWRGLFSGVGTLVSEQLQPMLDRLTAMTKSDEFQNYTLEEQQQIYDWINELQQRLGVDLKTAFENVGVATEKYNKALLDEEAAKRKSEETTRAYYDLLSKKSKDGKVVDPEDPEVKAAFTAMVDASNALKQSTNNAATALDEVQTAAQDASVSMGNLVEGLNSLSSGNVRDAMKGIGQIMSAFNTDKGYNLNDKIAKWASKLFPENDKENQGIIKKGLASVGTALGGPIGGELVGMAFDLLDIFQDGIENLFSSLIDTVLGSVNGLLNTFLSLDVPIALGESLMNGMKDIANTLTFGGFSSWFGSRESDKHYERDMERLTASNERLESALNRLNDTMEKTSLANAGDVYDRQKDYISDLESNLQEQIYRSAAAYKKKNIFGNGGHSSGLDYITSGIGASTWQDIAKLLGKDWSKLSTGDMAKKFLSLSAEEMRRVAEELPSAWMEITKLLDKGYKDANQYLEEYISLPDQLQEIEEAYASKLTATTFDSVRDSFKSLLLDMDSDTDDFISNFEKSLQQAIVNSMMDDTYNDRLKKWYNNFKESMGDANLSSAERDALKSEYDSIVADALRERDALKTAFGWGNETESQKATAGYTTQLSEDTGTEIVGRMTAMLDVLYRIESSGTERNELLGAIGSQERLLSIAELTVSQLDSMISQMSAAYSVHTDTRRILAEILLEIQQIRENTGAIIKPINSMKESLEKIEKNTKDLA